MTVHRTVYLSPDILRTGAARKLREIVLEYIEVQVLEIARQREDQVGCGFEHGEQPAVIWLRQLLREVVAVL